MPRPLSSQTSSSGSGRPCAHAVAGRVQRADRSGVVELASPKLQIATASAGQRVSTPSRRARPIANATPDRPGQVRGDRRRLRDHRERGVAEHLVPAARRGVGHGRDHARAARRAARRPASGRPAGRGRGRTRRSGSAAAPGRSAAAPRRRTRSTRARPSRSCRSPGPARASGGPGCRAAGCRPSRRTAAAVGRRIRGGPAETAVASASRVRTNRSRSSCGVAAEPARACVTPRSCPRGSPGVSQQTPSPTNR